MGIMGGRRKQRAEEAAAAFDAAEETLRAAAQAAVNRNYSDGFKDGTRITLELLLGLNVEGGRPYVGEMPEGLRMWAQDALRRVKSMS